MQSNEAHYIQHQFETLLHDYWAALYKDSRAGFESEAEFLAGHGVSREGYNALGTSLPQAVRDSYDYYLHAVEGEDWGVVRLYKVAFAGQYVYAVRVTTDGDDGWLELFGQQGDALGYGRTDLELIAWGDKDTIRAETASGEFPPELADSSTRTLWGK